VLDSHDSWNKCEFTNVDFSNKKIIQSSFANCCFSNVNFTGAILPQLKTESLKKFDIIYKSMPEDQLGFFKMVRKQIQLENRISNHIKSLWSSDRAFKENVAFQIIFNDSYTKPEQFYVGFASKMLNPDAEKKEERLNVELFNVSSKIPIDKSAILKEERKYWDDPKRIQVGINYSKGIFEIQTGESRMIRTCKRIALNYEIFPLIAAVEENANFQFKCIPYEFVGANILNDNSQ
jgi:hypothetical protein